MIRKMLTGFAVAVIAALAAADAPAMYVVSASGGLNVRTGPGTNYRVIRTLANGTQVRVSASSGSWAKLSSPVTGWVASAYLRSASSNSTSGSPTKAPSSNVYGLPRSYVGYLQLPGSGYGYYSYSSSPRRWGLPRMINGLIAMGRHWAGGYPGVSGRTLAYGDISDYNGGYISGHVSHQRGEDVDMRPITTSGSAGYTYVGWSSYSTYYSTKFAYLQRAVWYVELMLHNNSRISGTTYWPNHANHFHTRIHREY